MSGNPSMTDLLVRLYDLPDGQTVPDGSPGSDVVVRRSMASEKKRVVEWVEARFGDGWASECEVAFARQPIACTIAVDGGRLAGFACYDSTCLNFLGPIGVDPDSRRRGVGRRLLLATLRDMAHVGYAYAVIGGAGPVAFFQACVDALPIPRSTPGIYRPAVHDR